MAEFLYIYETYAICQRSVILWLKLYRRMIMDKPVGKLFTK